VVLAEAVQSANALREAVYEWGNGASTSERAEWLVRNALSISAGLQLAWRIATNEEDRPESGIWDSEEYKQQIEVINVLANVVRDILCRTTAIVASTQQKHPKWRPSAEPTEIESHQRQADQIALEAQETLDILNRPAPPVSEEILRRSRQAYSRGGGEHIADIIARLEGGAGVEE
jgi:hypothetical protein